MRKHGDTATTKSQRTTDHETIRQWAESRDGHPAVVRSGGASGHAHKGHSEGGILRIDFGTPEKNLERIEWNEFFAIFDENALAFLYQEEIDGEPSRFFKFVRRNDDEDADPKEAPGRAKLATSRAAEGSDGADRDSGDDDDDDTEDDDDDESEEEVVPDEKDRDIIMDVDADDDDDDGKEE